MNVINYKFVVCYFNNFDSLSEISCLTNKRLVWASDDAMEVLVINSSEISVRSSIYGVCLSIQLLQFTI